MILFLSFFPFLRVLLFLWVPEKILSLFDCGLSQEGVLALGRKGLFPLSLDCLSIHLSIVHPSPHFTVFPHLFLPARSCVPGAELLLREPSTAQQRQSWPQSRLGSHPGAQRVGRAVEAPTAFHLHVGRGGASTGLPGPLVTRLLCPRGFLRAPA